MDHEYGHQLQFKNNLPSVTEKTTRALELEADGFAESIGDYFTDKATHHGTPAQRRVAVRLGFLLGDFTLTIKDFDSQFFHYYTSVLEGTDHTIKTTDPGFELKAQIDLKIQAYMKELKDISSGEISAKEFKNLN
ncbi:TPA: hypothetical protein ACWX1I_003046 [Elizabethkingia anophelis]